jgi:DMSO reductase family type II enzyme heme b subunit
MASLSRVYDKATGRWVLTARVKAALMLAAVMAVGVALSLLNAPLASSAANSIEVFHSEEAVSIDPEAEAWNRAKEAEIPLSSQQIYQPGGGSTRLVRVRAMEDGQTIGFRVSWSDDTRDDTSGNLPSDAAAVQLPMDPENVPYQCMGQATSRVNIWQWNAALERQGVENAGAAAMEDAGVRNLTSNGICRAVDVPGIGPRIRSHHNGREWHVVFYRAMHGGEEGSAPLIRGKNSAAAFAVWNGSRGEARGMKAVSTWNTLLFESPEQNRLADLVTLGLIIAASAGAVAYTMRRVAS